MSKSALFFLISAAIFLISIVVLSGNIDRTPFHGDESGWISTAYYFTGLLLKLDFSPDKWEARQYGSYSSRYNLHAGQFLMGVPLEWLSSRTGHRFYGRYNFSAAFDTNKSMGNVPPKDILSVARRTAVFFGALCCVLMFCVGYFAGNFWVGFMGAALLITNRVFITSSTRAMTDVYYNFFLLCSYLCIIFFIKTAQKKFLVLSSLLSGIFAGLATSVKIVGIGVVGPIFFICLMYAAFIDYKRTKNIVLYAAIFLFSAIAAIYILNPYFWGPAYPLKFLSSYKAWHVMLSSQEAAAGAVWGVNRTETFVRAIFFNYSNFPFEWIFFCGGMAIFSISSIYSLFTKRFNCSNVPFLIFLVNYLFIFIFMKMNRDRYYLPTIIAGKFVMAGLFYYAVSFPYNYFFKNRIMKERL